MVSLLSFRSLRPGLAVPLNEPLVCGQLLQAHRAASAQLLGADADFSTQAELRPVRKARGSIDIDAGRDISFILMALLSSIL